MPFGRRWFAVMLLLMAPVASAWNDAGHMITALIAYDELSPAVRARTLRLLRAHPRFHEDFERQLPRNLVSADAVEKDRWYFAFGATWPDAARRFDRVRAASRDSLIARYNHGSWHYINLPTYLRPSDRKQIAQNPPSMRWTEGLDDTRLNIVQALDKLTANWCAPFQTDADRGLAVSWIVHLIGDLHQPLHSTALYAVPVFIHGDRGGNDIAVVGGTTLHALWDGALGEDRRLRTLSPLARDYASASAAEGAKNIQTDLPLVFQAWARRERALAARVAYSQDVRSAVAAASQSQVVQVRIDDAYRAAMATTARQQIGLAGHRIAWVLAALIPEGNAKMCDQRGH
jgi:hypothetical protein